MKTNFISRLLIAAAFLGLAEASTVTVDGAQMLFNGKDLAGWRKPTGTWTVVKGVSLDPADAKSFVITPGQGVLVNSTN